MTEREKELLNQIFDCRKGIEYYDKELEAYPNDYYVQKEFKRRREVCQSNMENALNELKGGEPIGD